MNRNFETSIQPIARAYTAPQLNVYGAMAELTAGGSAGNIENQSGGTGVNCGSVTTKRC